LIFFRKIDGAIYQKIFLHSGIRQVMKLQLRVEKLSLADETSSMTVEKLSLAVVWKLY